MVFLRQLLIMQHGIHGISLNKCNLRTLTFKVAFICFTMLKVIFDKRYLNFCPRFFGNVGKWFDLKIYDLTDFETNNCNTHNVQYFMKLNQPMKIGQLIAREICFQKNHAKDVLENLVPDAFTVKPVYFRHLAIADNFQSNQPNHNQALIEKPLCSGHFYNGHNFFWHRVKCSRQIYICLADKYLLW